MKAACLVVERGLAFGVVYSWTWFRMSVAENDLDVGHREYFEKHSAHPHRAQAI